MQDYDEKISNSKNRANETTIIAIPETAISF